MDEVYLKVYGDVQGVSFRYYTFRQAQGLKLRGWARNAPDGTVEIIAQGKKEDLESLIEWAKKGPDSGYVAKVEVKWQKPELQYRDFEIRY